MILKSIVRIVTALSRSERIVRMNMKQYVRSAENVLCSVLYAEMFSAIPATGTTKTTVNVTVSKGAVTVVGTRTSQVLAVTVTATTGQILQTVTLYVTSGRKEKMREILFRGKDKFDGEWCVGSLSHDTKYGNCFIDVSVHQGIADEVIPETVGQYTGLTDKNDTKIFEGDIIRDEDGDIMVVKWLKTSAAFVLEPKPFASIYFYGTLSSRIEVIGNIHDNPELLEVAENE